MYLQLYILSSLITYAFCCYFLQTWDPPYTKQRTIALRRSMENYLHFTFASLVLSYHGFGFLPTADIGIWQDLLRLALWAVTSELIFSLSHYALHSKYLYWIHKQHHENKPTYSTSCLDCHPIEFFTSNVGAIALPMVMYPGSVAMSFFWIVFATANTCHAHSIEGAHTIHHERFRWNYGQGGYVFDRIIGTFTMK